MDNLILILTGLAIILAPLTIAALVIERKSKPKARANLCLYLDDLNRSL